MVPRPIPLQVQPSNVPLLLQRERRWVCWRYALRDGRWTKIPSAKTNEPSTWMTFASALITSKQFDGIGFALGDGWAGIDVDDYLGHECNLIEQIPGYRETSPGGCGIKIIGRADRIGGQIDFKTEPPIFTRWIGARFFAVTGHGAGDPMADLTPFLDEWFPAPPIVQSSREGYSLATEMSDDDLLLQMIGGDDSGRILALWRGDTSGYASRSEADLALCCHLAFWTNYDADRVDRMFRQSGLMREKWGKAYQRSTLQKALR